MSNKDDEMVLVIPTRVFRAAGYFQGFSEDVTRYGMAILKSETVQFMSRREAEVDAEYKQLIPYVIFQSGSGNDLRVFQYRRGQGQGERRLHGRRSIGVGGHISAEDLDAVVHSDVYKTAMLREIKEEVSLETEYKEQVIGFINDDSNDVGRVHLGIVHSFELQEERVFPLEADMDDTGFWPMAKITEQVADFESWSQICIRALFA
jgi:predicted NUDIX family phosphoesterase